jgi:putative transposase
MPRPKCILQSEFPYHVTARSINKERFQIPLPEVWKIMSRQLCYVTWAYNAKIHSFVLMPNHFHLLISTPNSNLDLIMANFMKECSRYINESSGRINQAYGARHFRGVIDSDHYYFHAYKYVYRNPVEAGLVSECENYMFSSLNFILGGSQATFPTVFDQTLFSDIEKTLKWINQKPLKESWEMVSSALKKSKFRIAKNDMNNKAHRLEFDML